jgi:fructokinase
VNVTVCGEALIDEIETPDGVVDSHPGGSPANTAAVLAMLGISTQLITRLGDDKYGKRLRIAFEALGVDISLAQASELPTTVATAKLDANGNATYEFTIDNTWRPIGTIDADALVVSGSLALPIDSMFPIVFDLNIRPALAIDRAKTVERMNKWIERATIVKASAEDIAWAYPNASIEDVAQSWLDAGATHAFVTDGGRGAYGRTKTQSLWVESPRVEVVDTVGAGDTFTAAMVSRLQADLETQLRFATDLASQACTRAGGPIL